MIKNRLSLDNLGVQLEIKDKGLYVSFYLDADYGTKPICSILMDDLIIDYNSSSVSCVSQEEVSGKHFIKMMDLMGELYTSLVMVENIVDNIKPIRNECPRTKDDDDDDDGYPSSGFGDDFGTLLK